MVDGTTVWLPLFLTAQMAAIADPADEDGGGAELAAQQVF